MDVFHWLFWQFTAPSIPKYDLLVEIVYAIMVISGGLGSSHETLEIGSAAINEITSVTPGGKPDPSDSSTRHLHQREEAPLSRFSQKRHMHKFRDAVRSRARRFRSAEFLGKLFPCVGFAREYTAHHLVSDCIAGLTLALTVIPMGIGYAALAELPLQVLLQFMHSNFCLSAFFVQNFCVFFFSSTGYTLR